MSFEVLFLINVILILNIIHETVTDVHVLNPDVKM